MQDHSTLIPYSPLSFTQKESYTKRNIGFIKELDSRMKNDINAGRRKLFNSLSTGQMREVPLPNITHHNQAFFRDNVNQRVLQHEKSNPDLGNHQQRQVFNQVPEETDTIINKLVNQLNQTKRQRDFLRYQTTSKVHVDVQALNRANITISQLQQVISQNDSNARQIISKLDQQKEQLKLKSQQMAVTLQNSFKTRNDKVTSKAVSSQICTRCEELKQIIRKIEGELRASNLKYQKELQRIQIIKIQNTVFISELQQKYREIQEQLKHKVHEVFILKQEKRQLENVIFKFKNSPTLPSEEYQNLRVQYENLRQANKILQTHYENLSFHNTQGVSHLKNVTQKIHQILLENEVEYQENQPRGVQKMLNDLQFMCHQYKTWLQQAQIKQNLTRQSLENSYRKLESQYNQYRGKVFYEQQCFKQKIEQLTIEIMQNKEQNRQKSYSLNTQSLNRQINQLKSANQQLRVQIAQKNTKIKQRDTKIQEKQNYNQEFQFVQRESQQLKELLKQKDQAINSIKFRLIQTQQELIEKNTIILQKQNKLEQTQNFMQTVISQQVEQLNNYLNEVLVENQNLKNENYQLKGYIQLNPILQQANKKLLGELQMIKKQYQMVVSRNRGLQIEMMTVAAQNNKNIQTRKLFEIELQDLRKQIENKQTSESPSKQKYSQQIGNFQRELTYSWEEQRRVQSQANQKFTQDLKLTEKKYEQNNLEFDYKQKLQSQIQIVRNQLQVEFNRKIAEKQLSLASLTASSEKYGQILIKYNTLNIDYQTLISQNKQKEQHFQRQLSELQYILENSRREAEDKIRQFEEVNRQLQERNNLTYKNLQNAENYIYQLIQKLKFFQQPKINLTVEQVRIQLISQFNKEKEHIKDTFEAEGKLRQNQIINHRNELNHKEQVINVLTKEIQDFENKMRNEEQEYTSKIESLSQQLRAFAQQNNVLVTHISSQTKEIDTLRQTINGKLSEQKSRAEQSDFGRQIDSLNYQIRTLTQQNSISVFQVSSKNKQIEALKQTINQSQIIEQKSRNQNKALIIQIDSLSQQIQTLTQQNNLSVAQLFPKTKQIQSLKQALNEQSRKILDYSLIQTKSRQLQQHVQLVTSQINKKDQELKQFTSYNQQLRVQNVRLESQLRIKIQEISVLRASNEQQQTSSKTSSRLRDRSEYRQGLSRVENELKQSRRQVTGAENHIKQLEETIIHAQQQIKHLNSYIVDLQKKSQTNSKGESPFKKIQYETEVQDLKIQLQNLNVVILERQQKIIILQRKLVSVQSQNQNLKTLKQQVKKAINQKNQKQAELVKDLQFFKGKLDEAENYIFYLEKEKQEQNPVIAQSIQQLQQDDGKLSQITLENQNLTNIVRKLENDNRDLKKLFTEKDNALVSSKKQVQQTNKQIQMIEMQRDTMKVIHSQQLLALQAQIITLKDQKEKLTQENNQVRNNQKSINEKIVYLQRQNRQNESKWQILLEKKGQQKENIQRQVQTYNGKIRELSNNLALKQGQIQKSKSIIHQFQTKIMILNKNLVQIQQNKVKENTNIEVLRKQLIQREQSISTIRQQLDFLKSKDKQKQTQLLQKIKANDRTLIQNQEQLKAKTQQTQFFKNKLAQAQQYIYRIQNSQPPAQDNQRFMALQQQIALLKVLLQEKRPDPAVSELRQQIEKSKDSIRNLEAGRTNITSKYKQSQSSVELIQSNLSDAMKQTESFNLEITRLKQEKIKIQQNLLETKSELQNTEAEFQFFKSKLNEAEDYILYLESTRGQEVNPKVKHFSQQIEKLNIQINDLISRNKELENEKNKLVDSVSKKSQELKQINVSLENYQRQLKQELAKVQFLEETKKRSDEKISDYKLEIEKASEQVNFFKDKLRQAENYINYFEEEKLREQQIKTQISQSKDKSGQLVATILNLEAIIKNIQVEKDSIQAQLQNKKNQSEAQKKQIQNLKKERESLLERVTYSENLLMGNVEKIQSLQKQLREADQKRVQRQSDPSQQSSQYERLIIRLKERTTQLEEELQLSYRTIDQLKQSVNQVQKQQKKQQKTFARSNFTEIPREDDNQQFFKNKLLQAQSYIDQLQKQKAITEKALVTSEAKVTKAQFEIQHLSKELIVAASDKKILESNILQLNTLNQNLKDSLRVASSNSNIAVAIQLNEENNRLKESLLNLQTVSRRQVEILTNKINQLQVINDEYKQKFRVSEQANAKLTSQIENSRILLQNSEIKALLAEKQIANLQLIKQDNEELLNALASLGNLKENLQRSEKRNAQITNRLVEYEQKIINADKNTVALKSQIDLLKNKLLSSERFIVELQKQLRQNEAKNYDEEKVRQQIEKINELQYKNKQIEMKLILSEQKQKRYIQTIQTQQTNLSFFKQSLNSAEQEIEVVKRNIDFAQKKTKQDAQIIKVLQTEINRYGKGPQQQAAFFKSKLLEAQAYITNLNKQNKELKEKSTENKYENLQNQIQSLNEQIQHLHEELILSESQKREAQFSQQQTNLKLTQISQQCKIQTANLNQDITKLKDLLLTEENKYNDDIEQLRKELIQCYNQINQLKSQNEKIQEQNDEKQQKIETLEAQLNSQTDKDQEYKSQFFKQKLFEAQSFIKQLQEQKQAMKLEISSFSSQIKILSYEISKLKEKQALSLSQSLQRSKIDQKHIEQIKEAEQQLTFVNSQNLQLKLKIKTNAELEVNKSNRVYEINFLKEKLYQAQSYIVQLDKEIESFTSENIDKEAKIKEMEYTITTLNEHVVESESQAHQLQLVVEANKQLIYQLSQNLSSKQKVQTIVKANEEKLLQLNIKLSLKESELQKKQNEINQIKINLTNEVTSLKQKLLQAESYITELQRQNQGLNMNIADLDDQLKQIKIQVQILSQTLNNSETEKNIINDELQNLRVENQVLRKQIQKGQTLLQVGSEQEKIKLSTILRQKQKIQTIFTEQKLKINIELNLVKNELYQKTNVLQQTLQLNHSLYSKIIELQTRNAALLQQVKVQEKSIENISNSMILKQEKLATIQPLIQKLQEERTLITELQEQKTNQYTKTSQLLDQINRITGENNNLHEKLQELQNEQQEEAAIAFKQLERLKEDYELIKKDNQALQSQLNLLTQQISHKAREVDHKNQLIYQQEKNKHQLQNRIDQLQKYIQELKLKIKALENVEKQFVHLKSVIQEKEAADRELTQIQKEIQEQNINKLEVKKQSKDSSKNKGLEQSLEQAKKQLQNELREQTNLVTKELQREIDYLKNIVSQKEQETRFLQEQKLQNQQIIKHLEESNQQLIAQRQNLQKKQKVIEQLQQDLVQTESKKLMIEQEANQLRGQLQKLYISLENYQKHKLRLQNEILIQKNQRQSQITSIESAREEVKIKQKANEDLQNNIRNIILDYEGRIEEYNNNINLLNNRLGQSQAKNEQLESKIKSIIIQEQPTEIIVKERQQQNIQSEDQVHNKSQELQLVREQLIQAESLLSIVKSKNQVNEKIIQQFKSKIEEKDRILSQQTDKLDILMTEQLKQKEQIIRKKELIEQDLDLAEKKISQKELQIEGKEEKLGSSIRKLINITNNFQQDQPAGDPTEVLEELESFPYLNELITSILYRLRLSSAIELQKSLKIQSLKNELEISKSQIQSSNDIQLKKVTQILKSENEQLKADILKLTQQNQNLVSSQHPGAIIQAQQPEHEQCIERQAQLLEQIELLKNQTNQLKTQLDQLEQIGLGGEKYNQLLRQCADYEIHNGQLEQQLKEITQAHQNQKIKLKEYQEQIQILLSNSQSRDLYQENQSLKQKLTESKRLISSIRDQDSLGSVNTQQQFKLEFLHLCLNKVDQIENEVRKVESEIQQLSHKEQRSYLPSSSDYKPEDSHLMERLQELEEQLIKNAENIREHHQKSDAELYILLRDIVNDEQIPAKSKEKIEDYLAQLQQQIVRQYEQDQNEVAILKEQIVRNNREGSGQFSDRSRQNLIREIQNLNNAIEIYHQETMRRKIVYKRVLQGLLLDIKHLSQKYDSQECSQMVKTIEQAIKRNDEQDLEFDGEDFIITGGNGSINVQMLEEELEQKEASKSKVKQSKNKETLAMQTHQDKKPFLKFLLSAQDLDKQDMKLLKRKIAQLRGRQIEQNMQVLKNKEKRLQQVLQLTNKQTSSQHIQNIMLTLANNYSRDEISQIFGSEDNDQLINKLNEALCLEESFYKGLNSSQMMQQIEQRKKKYYQIPTKLSQEIFKHLLGLLSAKRDDEFYQQVDSLFRSMYEIQDGFEVSLRKKDEIYRSHNQRMNQIFNRSSSENSQDYLAEFERGNVEEIQLQMRSEKKPHRSAESSEFEQSPPRA